MNEMKYSFGTRTSNSPPARSRLSRGETGHTRERTSLPRATFTIIIHSYYL